MRTRALMDYWQIDELLLGNNILKDNVNDQSVNTKHHDYDDNQTWNLSKHGKNCECCPGHYLSTSVY